LSQKAKIVKKKVKPIKKIQNRNIFAHSKFYFPYCEDL